MNCLAFLSRAFSASRPLSCKSLDPEYPDSDNCVLRVIRVIRDSDKAHIALLWSASRRGIHRDWRGVSRCYRHIAPLERKAKPTHQNSRRGIHRRGEVASPSGLGQPTPTGSGVCDNTTLRSSGARGLDVSRCYRHIAPLERKAKPNHPPSPNPY